MVVDEILSKIIKGEYKDGDRLPPENVLTEGFGVSRVTIREAFKKLNTMGVVAIRQGEGTYVNRMDMGTFMRPLLPLVAFDELSINMIYEARLYIESGTVALMAKRHRSEETAYLQKLLAKMQVTVEEHDSNTFTKWDSDFHYTIGKASKNDILLGTYTTIMSILHGYISRTNLTYKTVEKSYEYHVAITDAIMQKDSVKAEGLMREHINHSKISLIRDLKEKGK